MKRSELKSKEKSDYLPSFFSASSIETRASATAPLSSTAPESAFHQLKKDEVSKRLSASNLGPSIAFALERGTEESETTENDNLSFILSMHRNIERSQKSVSGSQFKTPINSNSFRCEFCAESDKSLKKSKEMIRSLKLQITRLEDKYVGLKKSRTGDGGNLETLDENEIRELLALKDALQSKSDNQELEISRLKKTMTKDKFQIDDLSAQLDIANSKSELLFKDYKNKENIMQEEINQKKIIIDQHSGQVRNLADALEMAQAEIKALNKKLESQSHIIDVERDLEKEKRDHLSSLEKNRNLNTRLAELERELKIAKDSLNISQTKNEELSITLKSKHSELEDTLIQLGSAKIKCGEMEHDIKCLHEYQKGLETELEQRNQKIEQLSGNVDSHKKQIGILTDRISELMKKIAQDSELNKKALETAIAGSVRLCVVAPTVNVHISEKKLKLKGALSDKALTDFLSTEVLSKYSFLFKQLSDDTAPDGSSLHVWIQRMLSDMQKSIEQHVNSAMDPQNVSL